MSFKIEHLELQLLVSGHAVAQKGALEGELLARLPLAVPTVVHGFNGNVLCCVLQEDGIYFRIQMHGDDESDALLCLFQMTDFERDTLKAYLNCRHLMTDGQAPHYRLVEIDLLRGNLHNQLAVMLVEKLVESGLHFGDAWEAHRMMQALSGFWLDLLEENGKLGIYAPSKKMVRG